MFPILLDLQALPVAVIGSGEATLRRLRLLDADNAQNVRVFSADPPPELAEVAGHRLVRGLPAMDELAQFRVVFIADLPRVQAERLAEGARSIGVLVNTEDDVPLCDFHVPAMVRRGQLVLSVSTGGASPALARILRRRLAEEFDENWGERLEEVARWRQMWRAEGVAPAEITTRTEVAIVQKGWVS